MFAPIYPSSSYLSPDLLERSVRVRQLARVRSVRPGRLRQRHLPAWLPDHRPVRPDAASVHGCGHLHVDHPQPVHPYVPSSSAMRAAGRQERNLTTRLRLRILLRERTVQRSTARLMRRSRMPRGRPRRLARSLPARATLATSLAHRCAPARSTEPGRVPSPTRAGVRYVPFVSMDLVLLFGS